MSRRVFGMNMALCAAIPLLASMSHAVLAQAQPVPISPSRPADPLLDGARIAFEALPGTERKTLQENLIWIGAYSGMADGAFGRQTYDAIATFQRSIRKTPNGILTPADLAALRATAQKAKDAAGFTLVDDTKSGVRIGVPLKVLPNRSDNPNGGSRWQSQDGKVTLDTRVAPPDATLQSLYDRNLAIQTPGRVLNYKVLRPDFFVIAGETPTGKFYMRYAGGPAGIRAFSLGYDKALAAQTDPLVVAIANSFIPFPADPVPSAVAQAPAPKSVARGTPRLVGTGLVVGARQVLTTAPVAGCANLLAGNLKVQQVKGKGPFLLELAQDLQRRPVLSAGRPAEPGSRLMIVAYGHDGEGDRILAAPGMAESAAAFTAPLQPGAGGAPVLDMQGGLVGLAAPLPSNSRQVAGIVPSARYDLVATGDLDKTFPGLIEKPAQPAAAQPMSAADLVASAQKVVVPLTCEL